MSNRFKAGLAVLAAGVAIGLLSMPTGAGAHAVVTPFQPQSAPLTAARTLYVLRVPNEEESLPFYKVVMPVPAPLQEAISVRATPGWRTKLVRKWTGKTEKFGNDVVKIYAISKITWTAKKGEALYPGFFGDFYFRFQNPVQPQQICFPVIQAYGKQRKNGRFRATKIVSWTGPPTAESPASCVNIVSAPPAT
jgi:uncharacterized protein YcnI